MEPQFDTEVFVAKFMKSLFETAANDGIISLDEEKMIETIHDMVINIYSKALERAYEDGIITDDEVLHLSKIKDIINDVANVIALEDNNISDEELNLILGIMVALKVPKADNN